MWLLFSWDKTNCSEIFEWKDSESFGGGGLGGGGLIGGWLVITEFWLSEFRFIPDEVHLLHYLKNKFETIETLLVKLSRKQKTDDIFK